MPPQGAPLGKGVHHVAIIVRDLAACEAFYRDLLGLAVVARHTFANGQPRSVWLDLGGSVLMLELEQPTSESTAEATPTRPRTKQARLGLAVLALTIDEAAKNELAARLKVHKQTDYTLYVADPEGNVIGLSHYPLPGRATSTSSACA